MRAPVLLVAAASLGSGALAAERAVRATEVPTPPPALSIDAGRPLFSLSGLRHGDRAERCVTLANDGPGTARPALTGRAEEGDLAPSLAVAVTRDCGDPTVLWSGRLDALATVADPEPLAAGATRRYGIAVEVAGTDDEVEGRRAVHEFGFGAERAEEPGGGVAPGDGTGAAVVGRADSARGCETISFGPRRAGRRRNRVLVKYHRIRGRVLAKLIVRIYGAPGSQRLVLVTGLRIGRRKVLMGRRWGRVTYRVGRGARVTSRTRPYRVRIAPGVLRPGRNVVRVVTAPRRGKRVRARYVLRIVGAPAGEGTACRIG